MFNVFSAMKSLISDLSSLSRFDVLDACYLYKNGYRNKTIYGVVGFAVGLLRALFEPVSHLSAKGSHLDNGQVILFSTTKNQRAALLPLIKHFDSFGVPYTWVFDEFGKLRLKFSFFFMVRFYLVIVVFFLFNFVKVKNLLNVVTFRKLFSSFFYFYVSLRILHGYEGLIVFSNDHSNISRAFLKGALSLGVKTAYLQHAAVTKNFPHLEFDYVFLDGLDSARKYEEISQLKGRTFLGKSFTYGAPRMDAVFGLQNGRSFDRFQRVGIAINLLDDEAVVLQKISELIESTSYLIFVRPHPRLELSDFFKKRLGAWARRVKWVRPQSLVDYLAEIDILIAGDSSIHLEAVASGALSFYYNFGSGGGDYYGFLMSGISTRFISEEFIFLGLTDFLKTRTIQQAAVPMYFSNNLHPASSALMVARTMSEIINLQM